MITKAPNALVEVFTQEDFRLLLRIVRLNGFISRRKTFSVELTINPNGRVAESIFKTLLGQDIKFSATLEGKPINYQPKAVPCPSRIIADHGREYACFGESKNLNQWSQDSRCKVNKSTLRSRIQKLKWSMEDALSRPPEALAKAGKVATFDCEAIITAFGESMTILEWLDSVHREVPRRVALDRLRSNWKLERALKEPLRAVPPAFRAAGTDCPCCKEQKSRVINTNTRTDFVYRRHKCLRCEARFTTYTEIKEESSVKY